MSAPIAHEFSPPLPGYPELASVKLSRDIDRFEANAATRAEMARAGRWTLAGIGVASTILVFLIGFGAAAIAERGRININQWVASNEPV